jgi:hypothetical protein
VIFEPRAGTLSELRGTAQRFGSAAGRWGGTCGARQDRYRAACLRAAQAARPLEPVLGGSLAMTNASDQPDQEADNAHDPADGIG